MEIVSEYREWTCPICNALLVKVKVKDEVERYPLDYSYVEWESDWVFQTKVWDHLVEEIKIAKEYYIG